MSASVPVAGRAGYETADPFLIREAVAAFVDVVLGRRLLVWGGHPAITPMIWAASEALGVDYSQSVHLFQSKYFEDNYPLENEQFGNVTFVNAVDNDQSASLHHMRKCMFEAHTFESAVFIGGMEGIWAEYEMLTSLDVPPRIVAIPAPGGVAREIYGKSRPVSDSVLADIDFISFLYRELRISMSENRGNPILT